ncbi:unnamed protein product [Lepeophtheirus salmonis]|uniref:(salmon louse) hypothetical protein n=1 Tax=Lepeophtheirus salmonis TaxID=72036 RepID=A0A7R8CL13_LEPSM|nr:unnamed protein product [Lepeophtheirus salmonis]CAF2849438.1 unnamed protein product [Lepeophtheirus salmonis]
MMENSGVLRKSDSVQNILHGSLFSVYSDLKTNSHLSKSCVNLHGSKGFKSRIPTPTLKPRPPIPPKPTNLSLLVPKYGGQNVSSLKSPLRRETSSPPSLETPSGRSTPVRRPSKIPMWKGSQESLSSLSSVPCFKPKKWESCSNLEMYRSPSVEKKRSFIKSRHSTSELSAKSRQLTESLKTLKSSYILEKDRQMEKLKHEKKKRR